MRQVAYKDFNGIIYQPMNVGKGKYALAKIEGTTITGWYYSSLFVKGFETRLLSNADIFDSGEEANKELIRFGDAHGWQKIKIKVKSATYRKEDDAKPKASPVKKTTAAKPKAAVKKTTRKSASTQRKLVTMAHSDSRDRAFRALPPGKRTSKNGKVYYEYRPEHSDTEEERKTHGIKTVPQLRYGIKPAENFARPYEYEWFHAEDKYGKIVYKRTDHNKGSVWIGDMPKESPCVTHNHPNDSSLSNADVGTAINMGISEMRVASKKYDYYVRTHPEEWKKKGYESRQEYGVEANLEYQRINRSLLEKYQSIVDAAWEKECKKKPVLKTYTPKQTGECPEWQKVTYKPHCEQTHETMQILAKKFGWEYRRIIRRNRRK